MSPVDFLRSEASSIILEDNLMVSERYVTGWVRFNSGVKLLSNAGKTSLGAKPQFPLVLNTAQLKAIVGLIQRCAYGGL